jgi:integrase
MKLMTMHDRPEPAHRQPCSNATRQVRADAELRFIWIDGGIATRTHARTASAEKRHTVATFLVSRGELLRAQQRLGHRDASTTLRNYAHALPLEDGSVADDIDAMLGSGSRPTMPA